MKRSVIKTLLAIAGLGWLLGWAVLIGAGYKYGSGVAATAGIVVALSPIPLGWATIQLVRRRDDAKDQLTAKLRKELHNADSSRTMESRIGALESRIAGTEAQHGSEKVRIRKEVLDLGKRLEKGEDALNKLQKADKQTRTRIDQVNVRTEQLKSQANKTVKLTEKAQSTLDLLNSSFQTIENNLHSASLRILKLASRHGIKVSQGMTQDELGALLLHALRNDDKLAEGLLTREIDSAPADLSLTELRQLMKSLRQTGYLRESSNVMEWIAARSEKASDADRAIIMASEASLFEGVELSDIDLPIYRPYPESKVVVHLVGKSLPETQTGYTLRTHYTARALAKLGVEPVVAVQVGGDGIEFDRIESHFVDAIQYCSLPGPIRNTVPWDLWVEQNVKAFAELVCSLRPAVIHTHSDFINAMIAQYVGDRYGIPVVNETRGFWEESWLSRTMDAQGEEQFSDLVEVLGLPLAYTGRRALEANLRSQSSNVVTLAHVMDEHIEKTADEYELPHPKVKVVPNAVESRSFPVVGKDFDLLDDLDIPQGATIIGYISSIVEYEGIDTLIRGFYELICAFKAFEELCETCDLPAEAFSISSQKVRDEEPQEENRDNARWDAEVEIASSEALAYGLSRRFDVANGKPFEVVDYAPAVHSAVSQIEMTAGAASSLETGPDQTDVTLSRHIFDEEAWSETADMLESHLRGIFPDSYEDDGFGGALLDKVVDLYTDSQLKELPELRLLIVGDGAERLKLEALADELGIRESVIFTGRVPHEDVLRYYGLIDVFVVPRKSSDVTELVTPLKPFEAMSTGRACVFSNVRALKEIADEAGCVELFDAGNHHSLATTLLPVVSSPETIQSMGQESARWVRDARSWDLNALSYVELYQELGLQFDVPEYAIVFRELTGQGRHPRLMLELLEGAERPKPTGWFTTTKVASSADEIISEGWKLAKRPRIRFEAGFDWLAPGTTDRTWGSRLHQWEMVDPVLEEFDRTRNNQLLEWLLAFSLDWARFDSNATKEESMAWYDMAMSLRMPRLARIMIYAAQADYTNEVTLLLPTAVKHIREILKTSAFNANNNHGFFNAAACLDWAKLLPDFPNSDKLSNVGHRRLTSIVDSQFAADGGHLEHSPAYQLMLLSGFESAISDGLIIEKELIEMVDRASYTLGWMIQPNGYLVQFGDTDDIEVTIDEVELSDACSRFIETDGTQGKPNPAEMMVFPDSGYAFVRSPQPFREGQRRESSYLAFQAGFHSRAHKHADDLTFTWFDKGREILVDSGKYGYYDLLPKDAPERLKGFYYGSPERQYVESTVAHNTVALKGADIERRNREPFGSGLETCLEDNGHFVLSGRVAHDSFEHLRQIELTPGRLLCVHDYITANVENQTVVSWFNIDGSALLKVANETLIFQFPNERWKLEVSSNAKLIEPVRGQHRPLRGWRSREEGSLEPTWNFGFESSTDSTTQISTQFVIRDAQ